MNTTAQIARHLREVHLGGNWTSSNLKDNLSDITWQQATKSVYSFNTIAVLVYHINYYVSTVLKVLEGGVLDASDKFSFDCPPINSAEDWGKLKDKSFTEAGKLASLIEILPDSKLDEVFVDEKYGTYYRNFAGLIEHTHYHLGQIALVKKIVQQS